MDDPKPGQVYQVGGDGKMHWVDLAAPGPLPVEIAAIEKERQGCADTVYDLMCEVARKMNDVQVFSPGYMYLEQQCKILREAYNKILQRG